MGTPFLSEIRIFSFNYAPRGWAQCNGQILPINQNQALFSLLGTTYGGNGQTNFALPDLRERVPMHMGAGFSLGERSGQAAHTVTLQELPMHVHALQATGAPADSPPTSVVMLSKATASNLYATATNLVPMAPNAIATVGGSQAHENRQPFLALNVCIALQGIFPSQN